MILRHADWDPDVMPCMDPSEQDVESMAENLVKFHQEFHSSCLKLEQNEPGNQKTSLVAILSFKARHFVLSIHESVD